MTVDQLSSTFSALADPTRLAAMLGGIERGKLLGQGELGLPNGLDQHVGVLCRHLDRLADPEAGGFGDCRGDAHGQTIAPTLYCQSCDLAHMGSPCINKYIHQGAGVKSSVRLDGVQYEKSSKCEDSNGDEHNRGRRMPVWNRSDGN